MGRFRRERPGLASIALTTDTSILTAVANDYGYERVFQRQVEALCTRGDVLVGISTSGSSRNVYAALETARKIGALTIAFTGQSGGTFDRWLTSLSASLRARRRGSRRATSSADTCFATGSNKKSANAKPIQRPVPSVRHKASASFESEILTSISTSPGDDERRR